MSRPPRRRRILRRLAPILLLALATGAWLQWPAGDAERADWLEDLADLERHTARSYANLEWMVTRRGVDPRAVHDSAVAALARARTRREARRALQAFAASFEDGHFQLRMPPPAPVIAALRLWNREGTPPAPDWSVEKACRALGYEADAGGFGVALDRLAGFETIDSETIDGDGGAFPIGLLPLSHGRRAGVLRISLFSTRAHRSACATAWRRLRDSLSAPCGERCAEALDSIAGVVLLERLATRARALAAAGADLLVVDLTGNGGGENIVDPMARTLTPVRLRWPASYVLRHPHALAQLDEQRAALAADLARGDIAAPQRALLLDAVAHLDSLIAEVRRPCDWTGIWRAGGAGVSCRMLARTEPWPARALDYTAPGALDGLESKWVLFDPSRFTYREGAWTGPLVVLVDRRTASAAEGFASLLRDNDAATIIGERTYGAGCGYTNGGIRHTLRHTGLEVRLPDCVRSRADGTNEVEGVTPDVAVPWQEGDDGAARARRVAEVLAALPRERPR